LLDGVSVSFASRQSSSARALDGGQIARDLAGLGERQLEDRLVEIFSPELADALGRDELEAPIRERDRGRVERPAAEIVDDDVALG
jgi:hypothetical protein